MNYWLFVTTAENWRIIEEKSLIGVPKRNESALRRAQRGDRCLIYIKQRRNEGELEEPLVSGEFEIDSDVYIENTRIFDSQKKIGLDVYPLRLKLKRLGRKTKPTPFKPIIPKLSFIPNKKKWGTSLQGRGLIDIPEKDYFAITSFLWS